MRVHRLTLRDYRGVSACELTFAERGVTVIAGDNEIGKSSAAEALRLLLRYADDSTRASVKAVKALHLDRGAEVEAELSVGAHRFVYAKRWHRDRYTRLKVLSPVPEVLTGREAHDRVRALLAESVDLDLWDALSSPQATGLERADQAALRDHPSLVAALDAAAGGDLGAADDGQLLARAEAEAAHWFTPTGRPKAPLADLRAAAAAASAEVVRCQEAIERLEADVTWAADLQRSADDLAARHAAAVVTAEAAAAHLAEVEAHLAEVRALGMAAELARSQATVAAQALDARRALVAEAEATAAERSTAHAVLVAAQGAEAEAAAELEAAAEALGDANVELRAALAVITRAEADHQRIRAGAALVGIEGRLAAAGAAEATLAAAVAALAANPSTPAALAGVQHAHDDVLRAEAALAAGQTSVRLEALADVRVSVDGEDADLAAGQRQERGVTGGLEVEVPGSLRITVSAGAGVGDLRDRFDVAAALLAERCAALGVADLAGARTLEDDRRRLADEVEARRAALAATLAGTDVDALRARAAKARAALEAAAAVLGDDRTDVAPSADPEADLARARQAWDDATAAQHAAERSADRVVARATAAQTAVRATAEAVAAATRRVGVADERAAASAGAVVAARAEATEDQLEAAAADARDRAAADEAAWRAAVAGADDLDLDLEGAAATARRAVIERAGIERSAAQVREDLAGVRSRLEVQGEGGHHERLAEARRAEDALGEQLTSVEGRAAAARLLFATLARHRDEAARAYGAPLRAEIEALGRHVFGDGFGVVLDDDLRIEARVLDGVPVPWADLSVGAREQLAVLTRLAAATLVSPDGGVPVVFDDVLGFTDPERLARVSAAFEAAAAHCQIIVLTCDAERYRHLARAVTHHLTAPRAVATRQAG